MRSKAALSAWRAEDADLGLLLVEGWSYVADVLGFYDAIVADESYLGTAKRDRGLTRLLGLLGFRPRPGSGSAASISVSVSGNSSVPIPLSGVRSEAIDDEPPQVFENAATALAHPAVNGWAVAPIRATTVGTSSERLLLEPESGVGLSRGSLVLFRWPSDGETRLDAARVLSVRTVRESTGRTLIEVQVDYPPLFSSLTHVDDVEILVPSNSASPSTYDPVLGGFSVIKTGNYVQGFYLDAVYRALKTGQAVIVEKDENAGPSSVEGATINYLIEGKTSASVIIASGDPDVVAPVTLIGFTKTLGFTDESVAIYTIHYGLVRAGRLVRAANTTITNNDLPAQGVALEGVNELPPEPFRSGTFFLVGADGEAVKVQGEVVPDGIPGRLRFKLSEGQTFPGSLRAPVTIRGNVFEVTRGETVANELLGSGDSSTPFLSFKLARRDLTYLPDQSRPGRLASTLQVRVNGILWKEVDSFFGQGPSDEVYTVRNDIDDGRAVVTFGDGIRGRRAPTGTNNIVANYRAGVGATRPPANTINSVAGAIKGVLSVTNPRPAEGGSDPESPQTLRTSAPREALLLGRLVSVQDFEARARMEPGVVTARAQWTWDDVEHCALVRIVYVGTPLHANLESSIRLQAEPGVRFSLAEATPRAATLAVGVLVDTRFVESDVAQAVEDALLDEDTGPLVPQNMGIGQTVYRSVVFERILRVPGVVSVTSISLFVAGSAVDMFTACAGADPGDGAYFAFDAASITVSSVESTDPVHACGP
ncbi:baseplate J/gp47 family protein [Paraliomyxa miuraensis]|uniref:hypothetical protein n=1 Tax=Paraliomyxa miuraensis TaxID=376150 RepID=UPI0022579B5B|nr:hypothetical protein [Paraliomyxa miuraensis]MCX4247459.1 hypothetical protein [Paraliomyxa miuraensis]